MVRKSEKILYAYEVFEQTDMPIEPAPVNRDWMDQSHERFAYRCLPLVLANQSGWTIASPIRFTVRWNGGPRKEDLRIWLPRGTRESRVRSHFGAGVLTITIPYLFRTPKGVNLWVKGPSNWIKDGIQPLEGLVESDWSPATFTMNWKVTRPNFSVRFRQGEPVAMIVPLPRDLIESLFPRQEPLQRNEQLDADFRKWSRDRNEFNRALATREEYAVERGWQKDYFLGRDGKGNRFKQHQTRLNVRDFVNG